MTFITFFLHFNFKYHVMHDDNVFDVFAIIYEYESLTSRQLVTTNVTCIFLKSQFYKISLLGNRFHAFCVNFITHQHFSYPFYMVCFVVVIFSTNFLFSIPIFADMQLRNLDRIGNKKDMKIVGLDIIIKVLYIHTRLQ